MGPPRLRFRFTMRWLMIAVALVALGLGGSVAVWSQRKSREYQSRAQYFASMARIEAGSEVTNRKLATSMAQSARTSTDLALQFTAMSKKLARSRPDAGDPGIFGDRNRRVDPSPTEMSMAQAQMEIALIEGRSAQISLDQANSNARRAQYFDAMAQKYEQAAAHPMRSLPPDPPEPN